MGLTIVSGEGNPIEAGVTTTHRLKTNAVTQTTEHYANHSLEQAYNLLFSATPDGVGDCFLYLKNTSDVSMVIEGFSLKLAANEYIDINLKNTGTPAGGTDIVPVNLNTGSGNLAVGVFKQGNDITGLTTGNNASRIYHASSLQSIDHNFNQDIIVSKNGVFTMYAQTGTTALAGYIEFHYASEE